ncbi:MAG TPA: dihydroorotate dehydrogenase [Gemmatimonadaceae bacterium]|nr:dihydroorotate dehydrogenase [Gemmatimonadaceae bacterium]
MRRAALSVTAAGIEFQNPVLLAAGTAAYGRELAGVIDLDALGGLVTKAVSVEPRAGAPAPRVAEFEGGMINAVGLANPGMDEVSRVHLPWLEKNLRRARILVNVVGSRVEDYPSVIERLDSSEAAAGYELNVSCPNVKAGGEEFGADPATLADVVRRSRDATRKPIFVKLSPALADIARAARCAADAGADGISVVNTMPGLVIDVETRTPALGFGSGGVSGAGLLPVGVLATYKVATAVRLPVIGVGGISAATDIVQYLMAGASLVAVGTAAMQQPRLPEKLVSDLVDWCESHGVASLRELTGSLSWTA